MPDDLRKVLDAAPVPATKAVDLAALYRAAAERQAVVSRRWRRIAVGVAALAAGVLLVALLPRLEFRFTDHEFAVRWGTPPEVVSPAPDPRIEQLVDEQSKQLAAIRAANTKHAELQDLLLTLAVDVGDRDRQQQTKITTLSKKLSTVEADTARQFADAEKTNATLYDAVFKTKRARP